MTSSPSLSSVPAIHAHDRLRRVLWIMVAVLAMLITLSSLFLLQETRQSAMRAARTRANDAAQSLSEHVQRILHTSDFLVEQAGRAVTAYADGVDPLGDPLSKQINEIAIHLPETGHIFTTDSQGRLRISTRPHAALGVDLSDRVFYKILSSSQQTRIVSPLVGTRSGGFAFHLARRMQDGNGNFSGIVGASLNATAFNVFYDSLRLGPKSSMTFLDLQGRTVLRLPSADQWADSQVIDPKLITAMIANNDHGQLQMVSPFDGVERILSYQLLRPFDTLVVVGIAVDDVMAPWRRMAMYGGLLLAGMCGLLAWTVRLIFAALRREEALVHGLEDTVRQRTYEAEQKAAEARRANASKTRFLAATSHDLRQPLQAAGMFVEVLAVRLEDSPHLTIVDKLRQSIDATQSLMNTLLDATSLEAGKVVPQPQAFLLAPLMTSLIEQLEPQAQQAGLTLRMVPCTLNVVSDPSLLERILRNLLINALRYTATGSVLLGCRRRGGMVEICVVDTGTGIAEDQQEQIFEDFIRLNNAPRPISQGLGLGLSIVRRTADLLSHPIALRSTPGHGSCFSICVPRQES